MQAFHDDDHHHRSKPFTIFMSMVCKQYASGLRTGGIRSFLTAAARAAATAPFTFIIIIKSTYFSRVWFWSFGCVVLVYGGGW